MSRAAFQLLWDVEHFGLTDEMYDLFLERTGDHEGLPHSWPTQPEQRDLPEPIVLAANFGDVSYTHYPSNDRYWPIMFRAMFDALLSVGTFGHRVIPVSIVDPIVRTQEEHEHAQELLERRLSTARTWRT